MQMYPQYHQEKKDYHCINTYPVYSLMTNEIKDVAGMLDLPGKYKNTGQIFHTFCLISEIINLS